MCMTEYVFTSRHPNADTKQGTRKGDPKAGPEEAKNLPYS